MVSISASHYIPTQALHKSTHALHACWQLAAKQLSSLELVQLRAHILPYRGSSKE